MSVTSATESKTIPVRGSDGRFKRKRDSDSDSTAMKPAEDGFNPNRRRAPSDRPPCQKWKHSQSKHPRSYSPRELLFEIVNIV
jgi:hypothetical protein